MAYFNHAYKKVFVATNTAAAGAGVANGVITGAGVAVWDLKDSSLGYGPGVVGLFDYKTNLSLAALTASSFYVGAAALRLSDKQGPFHGGYQESNKSKMINPKYVRRIYKVDGNAAKRSVMHIGATNFNLTANADCAKTYVCGEDYNVRVDIKGADALRAVHHNLYKILEANGGCCDDPSNPANVDAVVIMKQFFTRVVEDPILSQFVRPILNIDNIYYAADAATAAAEETASGLAPGTILLFENAPEVSTTGVEAGLILIGGLVETKFKTCTFQPKDYYQVEPLILLASEVDFNGDPCAFEGLCVVNQSKGLMANGLGEEKLREVILSESYLQNFTHSDLRIREITQGDQAFDVIDKASLYSSLYILHSVPRFNNPSGVFDNDQYLLEIVGSAAGIASLETIFTTAIAVFPGVDEIEDLSSIDASSDQLADIATP